jgi:hypothetical protein
MRGSLVTFCAFLAFAVLCVEGVVTDELCGQVYDGLTEGRSDMDTLPSTSILGANWDGFDSSVLSYDWAIFSESVISQTTGKTYHFSLSRTPHSVRPRCMRLTTFEGGTSPDRASF